MSKSFQSATEFRISLQQRLKNIALKEGQDIQQIMKKVAFDRFLARFFEDPENPWYLKGGYALELQFVDSRATRDIDLVFSEKDRGNSKSNVKVDILRTHLFKYSKAEINDYFEFLPSAEGMSLDNTPYGGVRFDIESRIAGKRFVSFHVDISANDISMNPFHDIIVSRDWMGFAEISPTKIKMLAAEEIIAEKIHAYTLPRDRENSRTRDLLDMHIIIFSKNIDTTRLKSCLDNVFKRRKTHDMPSVFPHPPSSWNNRFPKLAAQVGINKNMGEVFKAIANFFVDQSIFIQGDALTAKNLLHGKVKFAKELYEPKSVKNISLNKSLL